MVSVLCIGGLDPSGNAGLSADIRALEFLGIRALPVAACLTVQTSGELAEVQPVPAGFLARQVGALLSEERPAAAKLGMLGSAGVARAVAEMLDEAGLPVITDPVMGSSTGFSMHDEKLLDAYRHDVFPVSDLVMPNAPEASALSGMDVTDPPSAREACARLMDYGPGAVLVKGGHFTGSRGTDVLYDGREFMELAAADDGTGGFRGTGCVLASLAAGHLASGTGLRDALAAAKDETRLIVRRGSEGEGDGSDRTRTGRELWHAVSELLRVLPARMVPEVGCNLAIAEGGAGSQEDVWTLDSRIVVKADSAATLGRPVRGRDSHVARVVLAAMGHDPGMRCALNLRYSEENLQCLERAGFSVGRFRREDEPERASSVEWGTDRAIKDLGGVPDAVCDPGGQGKEPMIRLLATGPDEMLEKLGRMLAAGGGP